MSRRGGSPIDHHVRLLGRQLRGSRRVKRDLLAEARDSLWGAAEGYRDGGVEPAEAERWAVAEFGSVPRLAREYQTELLAGSLRSLAIRVLLVGVVLAVTADLMWHGAPWNGPRPPTAYLLFSGSLDWLWRGLSAALGLGVVASIAVYVWSVMLWDAALTWPPMLIGGVALVAVHGWLGRWAWACLATTGTVPDVGAATAVGVTTGATVRH
ncbi:permease prefix domain 1-containing protein [Micromonospora sp. NPDC050397]|uniref:permease prefix domain 1-containing protein n=1 Tax=Micromonospora sp. NPDC050397 TaxID=3364279 RepID=UPI0038507C91